MLQVRMGTWDACKDSTSSSSQNASKPYLHPSACGHPRLGLFPKSSTEATALQQRKSHPPRTLNHGETYVRGFSGIAESFWRMAGSMLLTVTTKYKESGI